MCDSLLKKKATKGCGEPLCEPHMLTVCLVLELTPLEKLSDVFFVVIVNCCRIFWEYVIQIKYGVTYQSPNSSWSRKATKGNKYTSRPQTLEKENATGAKVAHLCFIMSFTESFYSSPRTRISHYSICGMLSA